MPKKRSTWQLTIHEDEDDVVEVHLTGPSNKVNDLKLINIQGGYDMIEKINFSS